MNRLRSLIVLPLAAAGFLAAIAQGQLTCETAQPVGLGITPIATLASFPHRSGPSSGYCSIPAVVHHAAYYRFTAPADGWYAAYLVPPASPSWDVRIAAADGCGSEAPWRFDAWPVLSRVSDGADACGSTRTVARVSFQLLAGESKIMVVGGGSIGAAGSARLRIDHLGQTPMSISQELALGDNGYQIQPLEPTIPVLERCNEITNASRFRFTPAVSGTYRVSFCDSTRYDGYVSTDPQLATAETRSGNCNSGGAVFLNALAAGTTYYYVVGTRMGNWAWDACSSKVARVEYIDPCPADFNDDDVTDGVDLGILLAAWGTPARDITGDGTTDGVDLGILLAMWGTCPEG